MNVLSLFDGIACGLVALKRAGIKVDNYYASEIDKYAIKIAMKNHPEIIQLGDIEEYKSWELSNIDLIMGGTPCQGFSFNGKMLNFEDPRSKLFFKFVECLEHFKPNKFLLENVNMKRKYKNVITNYLGVMPVTIDSSRVSAQKRKRLYWCNWHIESPPDKGLLFRDIKDTDESSYIYYSKDQMDRFNERRFKRKDYYHIETDNKKVACLLALKGTNKARTMHNGILRYLTPVEWERCQTLLDNYTAGVSNTQRYKMLGNGWTVDIISHILLTMNKPKLTLF